MLAGAGAHVDDEIGFADGVFIVFDHNHAVAQIAQALEGGEQAVVVALVVACAIGIGLQAGGVTLPTLLAHTLHTLGQASLAIGLLCVGAALDFSTARRWLRPVGQASLVKFLVMPLATLAACDAFGLHGAAAGAALLFQSLPTASSSYIMARQLGGDAPLMAGIIASQTVLAGLTLPAVMLAHAQLWP